MRRNEKSRALLRRSPNNDDKKTRETTALTVWSPAVSRAVKTALKDDALCWGSRGSIVKAGVSESGVFVRRPEDLWDRF